MQNPPTRFRHRLHTAMITTLLATAGTATAAPVSGGSATITLDPVAWAGLTNSQTIVTAFSEADLANRPTGPGTDPNSVVAITVADDSELADFALSFSILPNPVPGSQSDPAGRNPVATSYDYTGDVLTSSGSIGLGGAWGTDIAGGDTVFVYGDLGLSRSLSGWSINQGFDFPGGMFVIDNAVETATADTLTVSGDLVFDGGFLADFVAGQPSAGLDMGDVSFTLTTSPVPVPAAAWLFASGLLGLVAAARRRPPA